MNTEQDALITSTANRLVKLARGLHRRKEREEAGLYLVEGVRSLEEALVAGATLDFILYEPRLVEKERGTALLNQARTSGVQCWQVTESVFAPLSCTETPQGIIAVVRKQQYHLDQLLTSSPVPFLLLVDAIQDPGNLGTVIRTAVAAGVDGVVLTKGTVDLYNPKTIRATMGTVFRVPVVEDVPTGEAVAALRTAGIRLVAADVSGQRSYDAVSYTGGVAIAIGNEGGGISPEVLAAADEVVKIPLYGPAESLNAAVAAGILLYEAIRRRGDR